MHTVPFCLRRGTDTAAPQLEATRLDIGSTAAIPAASFVIIRKLSLIVKRPGRHDLVRDHSTIIWKQILISC